MSKRDKIVKSMAMADIAVWGYSGDTPSTLSMKGMDAALTAALPLIEEYILENLVSKYCITCAEAVCAERVQKAFKKLRKVSK